MTMIVHFSNNYMPKRKKIYSDRNGISFDSAGEWLEAVWKEKMFYYSK